MAKFTIEFPVIGMAAVTIETEEFDNADDLRDAIVDGDFDVEYSSSDNVYTYPVLNMDTIDDYELMQMDVPSKLEVR